MAVIIRNKSKCSLCEKTLLDNEEVIIWSPFLGQDHDLFNYSDSGMHQACFDRWEYKSKFEYLNHYQPLIDFEDPELKARMKKEGLPEWLKEIQIFRISKNKSDL